MRSEQRRLLLPTVILGAALFLGTFILSRRTPEPIVQSKKPPPQIQTLLGPPAPPKVAFVDVTAQSGIRFVHVNGATGQKLLPETMGGGCAFFDFDGDQDADLLLINSSPWPGDSSHNASTSQPLMALYENNGSGQFTDVTAGSGLDVSLYGMGVAIGDYDNDDRPDVFISAVGRNRLFHNDGAGQFRDVTSASGVGGSEAQWSTSCGWADFNNDGRLDLFVCNYVQWSRELDLATSYSIEGIGRAYGPPFNFDGTHPYLYRNDGNGRFTEISLEAGLRIKAPTTGKYAAKSLGVAPVDLDGDGWIDFIVANDTVPNLVFHNQGNGTFQEIGASSGLAYDGFGNIRGAMGIDTAWFRDDDALGVAVANFANEMIGFYVAGRNSLQFSDEAPLELLGQASRPLLKFGLLFFDYDLDGWPDLLTANGHLEPEIGKLGRGQTYAQQAQLFWNGGPRQSSTFVPVTERESGPDLFKPIVGRGAAYADIDLDGDLDVLLTQIAGSPVLLRNDQQTGHASLRVVLKGKRSNRDAIGARVTLRSESRAWRAQVMPTRGYLSQSELPITLGFGDADRPRMVEVRWPLGHIQKVPLTAQQRTLHLQEPDL